MRFLKAAAESLEEEYFREGFVIFSQVVSKSKWTFTVGDNCKNIKSATSFPSRFLAQVVLP